MRLPIALLHLHEKHYFRDNPESTLQMASDRLSQLYKKVYCTDIRMPITDRHQTVCHMKAYRSDTIEYVTMTQQIMIPESISQCQKEPITMTPKSMLQCHKTITMTP